MAHRRRGAHGGARPRRVVGCSRHHVPEADKHEAANILNNEQISLQTKLALIEALPGIIRESAKPMERIEGIKILQVEGLTSGGPRGVAESGTGGGGNLAEDMVRSALRYRAQAPIVDVLLSEIGMKDGLAGPLSRVLEEAGETAALGQPVRSPKAQAANPGE